VSAAVPATSACRRQSALRGRVVRLLPHGSRSNSSHGKTVSDLELGCGARRLHPRETWAGSADRQRRATQRLKCGGRPLCYSPSFEASEAIHIAA